jgi:hypothetical protein
MYSRKNTIVTLVVTFLCGQGLGFWPFDYNFYAHVAVYAKSDASETVYSESNAKRIAIIGMLFYFQGYFLHTPSPN